MTLMWLFSLARGRRGHPGPHQQSQLWHGVLQPVRQDHAAGVWGAGEPHDADPPPPHAQVLEALLQHHWKGHEEKEREEVGVANASCSERRNYSYFRHRWVVKFPKNENARDKLKVFKICMWKTGNKCKIKSQRHELDKIVWILPEVFCIFCPEESTFNGSN